MPGRGDRVPRKSDPLKKVREICLALPEASEKLAWGAPTFRVRDKLFVHYRDNHHELGSFLMAVLRNDLKDAVNRADPGMFASLKEIVMYCWWEIPSPCWGSPKAVHQWLHPEPVISLDVDDPEASRNIRAEEMP